MKKKGEAPREEISYVHILIALSVFVVCLCPFWVNHHSPHAQAGHVRPKTRHDARGLLAQGSPAGHAESVHMRSGIDTVALSASIQAMGDKQVSTPLPMILRTLSFPCSHPETRNMCFFFSRVQVGGAGTSK